MSIETAFTRLVRCTVPLQQAGMGGTATPELAIAVADAGALGMLGMPTGGAADLAAALEVLATSTSGAFGVNFLVPFLERDSVAEAARRARVVEFFYGDPDPILVALTHDAGALASWQVGSLDEAKAAEDSGCDMVVTQGVEAGGHVRGEIGTMALLDVVLGAVDVPVVAAGGIGTARAVADVLAAGASGARVGTRFVAAHEADTHGRYVDALVAARADDTVLTTTFSVMWPDAPHRVLRSCVEAAESLAPDGPAEGGPAQGDDLGAVVVGEMELLGVGRAPIPLFAPMPPGRDTTGRIDAMALYAGTSVTHVHGRQPAAAIVRELMEGVEKLLADRA